MMEGRGLKGNWLILALVKSAAALLLCMGWAVPAQAALVTQTMQVTATMVGSCSISVTPMTFPPYDGKVDVTTSNTIISNCTNGVAYQIHLDAGGHYSTASRHVADNATGAYLISYQLYIGATGTPWGDAGNTGSVTTPWSSVTMSGTGLDQSNTVSGTLFGGANVPVGSYSDVINITVTY